MKTPVFIIIECEKDVSSRTADGMDLEDDAMTCILTEPGDTLLFDQVDYKYDRGKMLPEGRGPLVGIREVKP